MPYTASTPSDDLSSQFLVDHGHETEPARWGQSYNKLQCPDCGALHDVGAATYSVCGWMPEA